MKKKIYILALAALTAAGAKAAPLNVCDFESYEIGTAWTLWQTNGGSVTSKAEVVADPKNAKNKVLHITLKDCFFINLKKVLLRRRIRTYTFYSKLRIQKFLEQSPYSLIRIFIFSYSSGTTDSLLFCTL